MDKRFKFRRSNLVFALLGAFTFLATVLPVAHPANATSLRSPQEIEDTETRARLERAASQDPAKAPQAGKALEELDKPAVERREKRSRREKGGRRIVNGISTFRFEAVGALLQGGDQKTARAWCSGTLIGCDKFLTAAHCIADDTDPRNYVVFFQNAGFFEVKDIRWPKAEYNFPYADVAVLTLSRSVDGIAPISLNRAASPIDGMTAIIVGFGRTGGDNRDYGIKRQGSIKTAACKGSYAGQKLVCWDFDADVTSVAQASNTCNADSGGGLFMWDRERQRGVQKVVGVTSGGIRKDCLKGDHSYDTDVFQHQNWILTAGEGRVSARACGSLPPWDVDRHVRGETARLSGEQPELKYTLDVPAGIAALRVAMNGEDDGEGRNDFNLYLVPGAQADLAKAACAEEGAGQFGYCEIGRPPSGPWTIALRRKKGDGLVQVSVTLVPGSGAR